MSNILEAIDDIETKLQAQVNKTCGGPNCSCDYAARRIVEEFVTKVRKLITKGTK